MNVEFLKLAESIKRKMELRFSDDVLKTSYVYVTVVYLIAEYESGCFKSAKTDIGVAAAKSFDSGSSEDNELIEDCSKLARMYKMR